MATTTFYSSSEDSELLKSSATWSGARDAASAASIAKTGTGIGQQGTHTGGTYYAVRGAFPFDTSSLPDGDVISSVVAHFRAKATPINTPTIHITKFTPDDATDLVVGDFDKFTFTSIGSFSPTTADTWYDDTLSDISSVSKTGWTCFGLLEDHDLDNTTPTAQYFNSVYSADETGTSSDPKLVVTHAATATDTGMFALMR